MDVPLDVPLDIAVGIRSGRDGSNVLPVYPDRLVLIFYLLVASVFVLACPEMLVGLPVSDKKVMFVSKPQASDLVLERIVGNAVLRLVLGDITEQRCDAIVNAANSSLMGGGGVDGAIHRKGGPAILEECKKIRAIRYKEGLPTGEAVATTAGALKAKYVIHAVGPVWRGGSSGEGELLSKAYRSCFDLAETLGVISIAFPSISTGAYGFPIEKASRIAIDAAVDFLLKGRWSVKDVRFVLFTERDFKVCQEALDRTRRPIS